MTTVLGAGASKIGGTCDVPVVAGSRSTADGVGSGVGNGTRVVDVGNGVTADGVGNGVTADGVGNGGHR